MNIDRTQLLERIRDFGDLLYGYPPEKAYEVLCVYLGGSSIETVSRETGVPRNRVEKWVGRAGITRSRRETAALLSAGFAARRQAKTLPA